MRVTCPTCTATGTIPDTGVVPSSILCPACRTRFPVVQHTQQPEPLDELEEVPHASPRRWAIIAALGGAVGLLLIVVIVLLATRNTDTKPGEFWGKSGPEPEKKEAPASHPRL